MNRRGVRVSLVFLFVTTLCGAAYQIYVSDRQIETQDRDSRIFDDIALDVAVSITDLRAAQQAYVVQGQNPSYWTTKVTSYLETITAELSTLQKMIVAQQTENVLADTAEIIVNFRQMDARAREYTEAGQHLTASDLIFTDGVELTTRVMAQLELARTYEQEVRDQTVSRQKQRQTLALITASTMGLLTALLLFTIPGFGTVKRTTVDQVLLKPARVEQAIKENRLFLAELDRSTDSKLSDDRAREDRSREKQLPDQVKEKTLDLKATAELCTDFGCISDMRDFPGLLTRVADLLKASSIIIWIGDPTGRELRAVLGHGYSVQSLKRMGPISRDAANATAAAYRAGQMRTVKGGADASGAIVVPLITATRCVGVITTEVTNASVADTQVHSVAKIIAAQVASLVAEARETTTPNVQRGS